MSWKKNYVYGQKHAFFLSRAPVNLLIPSDTFLNMIILYYYALPIAEFIAAKYSHLMLKKSNCANIAPCKIK